jgi:hypothetical protein
LRAERQFLPVEISVFFVKARFCVRFLLAQGVQSKLPGSHAALPD